MTLLLDDWYRRAGSNRMRIVLADARDSRALAAAEQLERRGLAEPIVMGVDICALADANDERSEPAKIDALAQAASMNRELDLEDPLVIAMILHKSGWADGVVAGASRSTADVLRAGLRTVGVAPQAGLLSSCFFFVLPDGQPIVYGDCGVVPDPTAEQLAAIAISSASTFEQLADEKARVAMLSFSTKGSAQHPRVDKVRQATELARSSAPELAIDGELQFDAAWVPAVAQSKAPESTVAGRANVFVFPDLDSGNIAYKITERLGHAQAFGPLLQGLDGVVHDLSRGCSVEDIINVSVIAALQAQAKLAE